jgi:predicted CoA-binding protein
MSDDHIKEILKKSKIIAMVGVSSEKKGEDPKNLKRKPANIVMKYMQGFGYKVIPVNPFAVGEKINGEIVVESLEKISEKVDIVDIFRPSKETPNFAKETIKIGAKTLWLQYGIQHEEAKKISKDAKIQYIENKCIKQEYQKLFEKSNPVFPVLRN